jgi:hypothetical protein
LKDWEEDDMEEHLNKEPGLFAYTYSRSEEEISKDKTIPNIMTISEFHLQGMKRSDGSSGEDVFWSTDREIDRITSPEYLRWCEEVNAGKLEDQQSSPMDALGLTTAMGLLHEVNMQCQAEPIVSFMAAC